MVARGDLQCRGGEAAEGEKGMKAFPAFGVLLRRSSEREAIEGVLLANSNLPGPHGNIELAQSFARALDGARLEDWHWTMINAWLATSAVEAPVNSPGEFLPFCAALSLGVLYPRLPRPGRRRALAGIQQAARDSRWRTREAAAMALQAIGEHDPEGLKQIVSKWMPEAGLLEKRAIAAALAHPPLLGDSGFALFCLSTGDAIMESVVKAGRNLRQGEEFRVLRQGLGYALSVFVAGLPEAGFPLLAKWAAVQDRDVQWILRENVKKTRLAQRHPEHTAALAKILSEGRAAGR